MSGEDMTTERLAANLRAAIKASGLTHQEVAERTDMDSTALSKALSGTRSVSSLELALICAATGSDVFGILNVHPLHGPSFRQGYAQAALDMRRHHEAGTLEEVFLPKVDPDGDYTGCGAEKDGHYCDLPPHPWPQTHHADVWWEDLAESERRYGSGRTS